MDVMPATNSENGTVKSNRKTHVNGQMGGMEEWKEGQRRGERGGGADHTHQTQYFSTYWYIHDVVTVVTVVTVVPYRNLSVPDIYYQSQRGGEAASMFGLEKS